jgi:hypothetical protein
MPRPTACPQRLPPFFPDWLIAPRQTSRHTGLAYREPWRLLLQWVAAGAPRPVAHLELAHRTATAVLTLLADLEPERHVTMATRPCRLAALRRVFAVGAARDPLAAAQGAAVWRMPTQRSPRRDGCSRDVEAGAAMLAQPDRSTLEGQRDHALLACL